ncbi:MAG: IclR family transcriptional regulator [Hyphomicrobiales bacterium]
MDSQKTKRNSPRRILEIMEAICTNPESATASGLSQALDIPVPTIYRWLDALCDERFIAAHPSGFYVPGDRFRDMMLNSLQYEPNVTHRRSILRSLSEQIGETVSLAAPNGAKLIYFDRLESHWPFQVNLKIGDALPLHCCASGKLYLSTIETKTAAEIYKNISAHKSTRNTITGAANFSKELAKIRAAGYALDNEEWFDDMVGVSVPIFSHNGPLIACLSTHALVTRKSLDLLVAQIPLMQEAARKLQTCLISE